MESKNKFKSISLQVLSCIVTIALCLGVWAAGLATAEGNRTLWIIISAVCGAIIVAAALINVFATKYINNKLNNMKMRGLCDIGDKLKADVEADYSKAEKSVRNIIAFSYIYLVLIIAVMLLFCFSIGRIEMGGLEIPLLILILTVFLMWGLIDLLFTPLESSLPPAEHELTKAEYPALHRTAENAAKASGCKKCVKLYLGGEGISVSEGGGKVIICLGYTETNLLTKDELYSVLLHEFAHVVNADSRRGKRYYIIEQQWSYDGSNVIAKLARIILLPLPASYLLFKMNTYTTLSSRYHEIQADTAVLRKENSQNYVNALAKTKMLFMFREMPRRELDYDFYEPERPSGDYAQREYDLFFKYREKYVEVWKQTLEKELPARVDSHPTFLMRFEASGCESYDAYCEESDETFCSERKKLLKKADVILNKMNRPYYSRMRKEEYTERKQVMDEYEKAVETGEPLNESKKILSLQAFYGVDNEKALQIANGLIAEYPDASKANYFKGMILFHRNDDACIDCFKIAAKDSVLAQNAVDYIGRYALKTGNESLLAEYRASAPEMVQDSYDKANNKLTKNSVTENCGFDEATKADIVKGILEAAQNNVTKIYVCKCSNGGEVFYPVTVVLKKMNSPELIFEVFNAIQNYLYMYSDKITFSYCPENTPEGKKVKNTQGALIYTSDK